MNISKLESKKLLSLKKMAMFFNAADQFWENFTVKSACAGDCQSESNESTCIDDDRKGKK